MVLRVFGTEQAGKRVLVRKRFSVWLPKVSRIEGSTLLIHLISSFPPVDIDIDNDTDPDIHPNVHNTDTIQSWLRKEQYQPRKLTFQS